MDIMGTIETILTGAGILVGGVVLSCMAAWFVWFVSLVLASLTFDLSKNDWKERSRWWKLWSQLLETILCWLP